MKASGKIGSNVSDNAEKRFETDIYIIYIYIYIYIYITPITCENYEMEWVCSWDGKSRNECT